MGGDSSIFDDLSQTATVLLGEGALKRLLKESKQILGETSSILLDSDVPVVDKLKHLEEIEQIALAEAIKNFSHETRDEEALRATSGLLGVVQRLKASVKDQHSLDVKTIVDFTHPKIQKGLAFVIELIVQVLYESSIEEEEIIKIIDTFSTVTENLEDKLEKAFNKVPIDKIDEVPNPLINLYKDKEVPFIPLFESSAQDEDRAKRKAKRLKAREKRKARREGKNNGS